MRFAVTLILSLSLLAGCVPKSDLDAAQAANAELKNQVAAKDQQIAANNQKIAELESRLSATTRQLERKPAMPLRVGLRKALLGGGYIAVFSTTVKQELPLLVTLNSKALGTTKQFQLRVPESGTAELGSMEGALIDPSDEIVVENTNYEKATFHFHQ